MSAGAPLGMVAQILRRVSSLEPSESVRTSQEKLKGAYRGTCRPDASRPLNGRASISRSMTRGAASSAARRDAVVMGDQITAPGRIFVAECSAPVVIVLEDLHWGDSSTIAIIDASLRNLAHERLLVLAFARPRSMTYFRGCGFTRRHPYALEPLSKKASGELVRDCLGDQIADAIVERVVEMADGNAFYLEELIRAIAEGKATACQRRRSRWPSPGIDAMPARARGVLKAASVFGQRFSSHGVAALVGGAPEHGRTVEWPEMLADRAGERRAKALGCAGRRIHVRHALLREAAYEMLTDGDRALGHALAGAWLERAGGVQPIVLAEHSTGRCRFVPRRTMRRRPRMRSRPTTSKLRSCSQRAMSCRHEIPRAAELGPLPLAHPGSGVQVARELCRGARCAQEAMIRRLRGGETWGAAARSSCRHRRGPNAGTWFWISPASSGPYLRTTAFPEP